MKVLQSNRANFNESRLIDIPTPETGSAQVKLRIERFSFTANNITYAVLGDFLKYWSFFPAVNEDGSDASADWGQIPVWGFASVVESNVEEVTVGERFFGYFPPTEECLMSPRNLVNGTFIDGSEHRSHLPAGYNIYRSSPKSTHESSKQSDNERSMLYPLFVTAYGIHDMLAEQNWHGADQVLVISASSKTSIGLAYALQADERAPHCIGLTSKRNKAAVENLDLYDSVSTYDDISHLDAGKATTIIDMSGNKRLLSALHQHLGDNMKLTLNVGITHWEDLSEVDGINAGRSEQFFAPSHIQAMIKRVGPQAFQAQSGKFISDSAVKTRSWLKLKELSSLDQLANSYNDVCDGNIDANIGLMVVLD